MKASELKHIERLKENKELNKKIAKLSYYELENFYNDAKAYIKAIKERRMICIIKSVSASGMSRNLKFNSCEHYKDNFGYRQYFMLFKSLGYSEARAKDGSFNISGCGMDMVFHTNYSIIHDLKRLGFINDEECRKLAQDTPTVL
jgi:hypothetical protein